MNRGKEQLSFAKITPPKAQNIIERQRLFSLLDEAAARAITWISAPAGSGKTTLISSYLDSRRLRCIWYQADAGDADLATFFYYAGLAAKRVNPAVRRPMPLLTSEHLGGIPAFTRRYFEELFSRLTSPRSPSLIKMKRGTWGIIVFDNYQDIPADSEFHKMLAHGLDVIPEGVRAVIISRTEPPPTFARFKANNKIDFLGWNDMRFTYDEAEELVRKKASERTSFGRRSSLRSIAMSLYEKADGWAAGMVLMLESVGSGGVGSNIQEDPKAAVFDYLATEVFGKTSKRIQEFLLKTAFLPSMAVDVSRRLTGLPDAGEILADLRRRHYFTDCSFVPQPVYRYHTLFREFLIAKAKEIFPSGELKKLQNRAAVLLEEAGQIDDAAGLLISACNWEGIVRLALAHAGSLVAMGRNKTLEEWLLKTPERIVDGNPSLLYLLGICRLPFDTERSRSYFEKAFNRFRSGKDIAGSLRSLAGIIETIFLERGDFSRMDQWIGWMDKLTAHKPSFTSAELEITVVTAMMNAILSRVPYHRRAKEWAGRARDLISSNIDTNDKITLASPLHLYYTYTGDFMNASLIVKTLRPEIRTRKLTRLSKIKWALIEAVNFHMIEPSSEKCLCAVKRGMTMAEQEGIHVLDIPLLQTGAYGAIAAGDGDKVSSLLQKMFPLIRASSYFDLGNYHCIISCHSLSTGDFKSALEHAKITLQLALKSGSPIPTVLAYLGMAQASFEIGQTFRAKAYLRVIFSISRKIKDFKWNSALLIPMAYIAFKSGREERGVRLLREALRNAREHHHLNMLHWRTDVMALICLKALEHGIETDYVKQLIIRRNILPPVSHGTMDRVCELWPYPLRIHTLGGFGIIKNDLPIAFQGRVLQKPLELLKAIIAFGGKDVADAKLMDALWPGSDGDKASQSLKFTLHALRRLLGGDAYILLKGGRLSLNPNYCVVDTWQLYALTEKIMSLHEGDSNGSELCKKAMNIYRGEFLEGDEKQVWIIPLREKLKSRIMRVIGRLCDYYEKSKKHEEAIEVCQRALEIDHLHEGFYRRLMLSYLRLGRHADAMLTFRKCRKILLAELGVEPSSETDAVYRKVRRNHL